MLISLMVGKMDTVLFVVGEGDWLTAALVLIELDGLEVFIDLVPVGFGWVVVAAEVEAELRNEWLNRVLLLIVL